MYVCSRLRVYMCIREVIEYKIHQKYILGFYCYGTLAYTHTHIYTRVLSHISYQFFLIREYKTHVTLGPHYLWYTPISKLICKNAPSRRCTMRLGDFYAWYIRKITRDSHNKNIVVPFGNKNDITILYTV